MRPATLFVVLAALASYVRLGRPANVTGAPRCTSAGANGTHAADACRNTSAPLSPSTAAPKNATDAAGCPAGQYAAPAGTACQKQARCVLGATWLSGAGPATAGTCTPLLNCAADQYLENWAPAAPGSCVARPVCARGEQLVGSNSLSSGVRCRWPAPCALAVVLLSKRCQGCGMANF